MFFNFMDAVTIHSDFWSPRKQNLPVSIVSPSICHEVIGLDATILVFLMLSFNRLLLDPAMSFIVLFSGKFRGRNS